MSVQTELSAKEMQRRHIASLRIPRETGEHPLLPTVGVLMWMRTFGEISAEDAQDVINRNMKVDDGAKLRFE